ncbi:hypothetical protein [Chromobacterium sphagni]|uniref:Uncharacterized protein n=1 Tax=Chromobacterium sphagni TaxID=1903179 RepID=A0ABX3C7F4_9NEIS|nr:hypothetical protein [Chromobacterium sphagni]OHX16293.1 hypothetical protein BI344_12790 [Chromobacterium sphagni]
MDQQKHAEALTGLEAAKHKIAIYWQLYVDWLAEIGWGRLALLALLTIIACGILVLPGLAAWLILVSIFVKIFVRPRRPPLALPGKPSEREAHHE